jgi:hypothetical protein
MYVVAVVTIHNDESTTVDEIYGPYDWETALDREFQIMENLDRNQYTYVEQLKA